MRPLYGDADDIQNRAERAERLARHANTDTTEQSAERALAELRKKFRGKWIAFDFAEDHTIGPRGKHHKESRYMVQIESPNGDTDYQSEAKSLNKLMTDLRQWHAEQAKES